MPRREILGNWVSGVRNSRKLNLYHYSFLETLYVGVILCAADWGYARMHQQLSGVWNSRKLGFRYLGFSETGLPIFAVLGNSRAKARAKGGIKRGPGTATALSPSRSPWYGSHKLKMHFPRRAEKSSPGVSTRCPTALSPHS